MMILNKDIKKAGNQNTACLLFKILYANMLRQAQRIHP